MIDIETIAPGRIRLKASGKIEKTDVEAAIAAIEKERASSEKISLMVDLTGFESMTPEAFVADMRYGFSQWDEMDAYERIAVITDSGWIESMVWLENAILRRIDIRCFETDEVDQASDFLDGKDIPAAKREPGVHAVPTDRADVFAFRITDKVTHDDTKALFARLSDIYEQYDKVDLMVIIEDFEGFEPSLLFDSQTWSAKSASLKHLKRYAVVGGPSWIRASASFFAGFIPVDIKTFDRDDEEAAWTWLEAKPVEST